MEYELSPDRLDVRLKRDLNLLTARRIEHLAADVGEVWIDLRNARLVDTEGVVVLYRLLKAGKTVRLTNPPPLLYEVIDALGLAEAIDLDALVVDEGAKPP